MTTEPDKVSGIATNDPQTPIYTPAPYRRRTLSTLSIFAGIVILGVYSYVMNPDIVASIMANFGFSNDNDNNDVSGNNDVEQFDDPPYNHEIEFKNQPDSSMLPDSSGWWEDVINCEKSHFTSIYCKPKNQWIWPY